MKNYLQSNEVIKDNKFSYAPLNSTDYRGWSTRYKEGNILYNICRELKPKVVLELGTFHGFSSAYFLSAIKDNSYGFLYSVDSEIKHIEIARTHLSNISKDFELIEAFSADQRLSPMPHVPELSWDKPIDLLFIDGAHDFKSVIADLNKFVPFVSNGGLILCHDYDHECKKAIDSYFLSKPNEFSIIIFEPDKFHNWLYIAYKE